MPGLALRYTVTVGVGNNAKIRAFGQLIQVCDFENGIQNHSKTLHSYKNGSISKHLFILVGSL